MLLLMNTVGSELFNLHIRCGCYLLKVFARSLFGLNNFNCNCYATIYVHAL